MMPFQSTRTAVYALLITLAALCILPIALPIQAQEGGQPAADSFLFLSFISRGGSASVPAPTPQPGDPTPQPVDGGFFAEPEQKTGSANVQIDAAGGVHFAYDYHLPAADNPPAVYAYCPGSIDACSRDGQLWKGVAFGDKVDEVQLRLTADGRPRLLILTGSQEFNGSGKDYYYAECDQNCGEPDGWSLIKVATTYGTAVGDAFTTGQPRRYFALDPQGRPRFVVNDRNYVVEPDHYGMFYYSCDAACTQEGSWSEALISRQVKEEYRFEYESMDNIALTFTRDGSPRIVGQLFPLGGLDFHGLYYLACDSGCDTDAGWERVKLATVGGLTYKVADLELDAADRPRIAFFQGDTLTEDDDQRLFYLTCQADCLNATSWQSLNLGLGYDVGRGVDLELDGQGRPRLAYVSGVTKVGYSWCDSGCEGAASWKHTIVDTNESLEASYPVARPITCNAGLWEMKAPVLALDGQGNPRIAYDAAYQARCQYEDPERPGDIYDRFHQIWHTARVRYFPQPS